MTNGSNDAPRSPEQLTVIGTESSNEFGSSFHSSEENSRRCTGMLRHRGSEDYYRCHRKAKQGLKLCTYCDNRRQAQAGRDEIQLTRKAADQLEKAKRLLQDQEMQLSANVERKIKAKEAIPTLQKKFEEVYDTNTDDLMKRFRDAVEGTGIVPDVVDEFSPAAIIKKKRSAKSAGIPDPQPPQTQPEDQAHRPEPDPEVVQHIQSLREANLLLSEKLKASVPLNQFNQALNYIRILEEKIKKYANTYDLDDGVDTTNAHTDPEFNPPKRSQYIITGQGSLIDSDNPPIFTAPLQPMDV